MLVKIGTPVKDILDKFGYDSNAIIISGGPMMGESIKSSDLVVSPTLNSVLVLENIDEVEVNCLRCGKCIEVCPANICPVLIKDNIENVDKLKKLDVNKCISCGLCSYICPSKILVRDFVSKAKEKIKGSEKNA